MGVNINWFKSYRVNEIENHIGWVDDGHTTFEIEYLDGDGTSHGYGNRTKLQNIFRQYLNIEIPTIGDELYTKTVELIEPNQMSDYCNQLLSNDGYNLQDMRDRISWIKEMSDKGYYFTYNVF